RPAGHDDEQPAARSYGVEKLAAAGVHGSVGEQEGGLELGELRVRDRNFALDGRNGDRQRLAIEVADRDRGAEQKSNSPTGADKRLLYGFLLRRTAGFAASSLMRVCRRELRCSSCARASRLLASSRCSAMRRRASSASPRR